MSVCPFCKQAPFHYVNNGCGYEAVAIDCCDMGIDLYRGEKKAKQALRFMRSHSPRRKARAQRIMKDYGQ